MKKNISKDVLEASGLIEADLNRFNLNRAWIQDSRFNNPGQTFPGILESRR